MANHDIVDVVGALKTYADTKTLANLADVESTSTASKAYAAGDHLVYNGVLYKVTAAIASGATLVPNTNIEAAQVEDEIDDVNSAQQQLLKNTVGWTGKNLLKADGYTSGEFNGVTFTKNADGSVTLNGTASASTWFVYNTGIFLPAGKYILSGCPVGGAYATGSYSMYIELDRGVGNNKFDFGEGNEFEVENDIQLTGNVHILIFEQCVCNNLTFYPMLRGARIKDSTFEPYHESVEVKYEEELYGVNLLKNMPAAPADAVNGITWTVNADGTVKANGTASADSYLVWDSGVPVGMQLNEVSTPTGNGYTITSCNDAGGTRYFFGIGANDRAYIVIRNGATVSNKIFSPMIYKAKLGTNLPYHQYNPQSIQNQLNVQTGVLGAKNLVRNTAVSAVSNGVTFTVNSDGTVTANGTATGGNAECIVNSDYSLKSGSYILSGCPANGGNYKYFIKIGGGNDPYLPYFEDWGGTTVSQFNVAADVTGGAWCYITIVEGQTVNNLTFKPMIRRADDPDPTYAPYAMTNMELTELINVKHSTVTTTYTVSTSQGGNHLYKCGRVVQMLLALSGVTASQWSSLGTIPEEFKPIATIGGYSTNTNKPFFITTSGSIDIGETLSNNNINLYATWISKV